MAIVTKPTTITKGVTATFSLNKTELAMLDSIVGDSYFYDVQNWSRVTLVHRSVVGNQKLKVTFNPSDASPSGDLKPSLRSRSSFTLREILIFDFDGGYMDVSRGSIPSVSNYDVTVS